MCVGGQVWIMKMLHVDGEYLLDLGRRKLCSEVMDEVCHCGEQTCTALGIRNQVLVSEDRMSYVPEDLPAAYRGAKKDLLF